MQYDFPSLFVHPPNSERELFSNINRYISLFEPMGKLKIKPAPPKDIQQLEQIVISKFGQAIPSSYKAYLERMGEEDGGLVSHVMDCDLEYWNYFKGYNMARGAKHKIDDVKMRVHIEHILNSSPVAPPFWYFYYTMLTGVGWGFSSEGTPPDQIVETHGNRFYFSHDTFTKLLFYCAYIFVEDYVDNHSTVLGYGVDSMDFLPCETEGSYSIRFRAECAKEWLAPGHAPLVNFLSEIETQFSIEECWFSGNKEFNLFDAKDDITSINYSFSRYVGVHVPSNLAIRINYIQSYGPEVLVSVLCQNVCYAKQIVDSILQQVKLKKGSFRVLFID